MKLATGQNHGSHQSCSCPLNIFPKYILQHYCPQKEGYICGLFLLKIYLRTASSSDYRLSAGQNSD